MKQPTKDPLKDADLLAIQFRVVSDCLSWWASQIDRLGNEEPRDSERSKLIREELKKHFDKRDLLHAFISGGLGQGGSPGLPDELFQEEYGLALAMSNAALNAKIKSENGPGLNFGDAVCLTVNSKDYLWFWPSESALTEYGVKHKITDSEQLARKVVAARHRLTKKLDSGYVTDKSHNHRYKSSANPHHSLLGWALIDLCAAHEQNDQRANLRNSVIQALSDSGYPPLAIYHRIRIGLRRGKKRVVPSRSIDVPSVEMLCRAALTHAADKTAKPTKPSVRR